MVKKKVCWHGMVKDFNPEEYYVGELETIAAGHTCAAYLHMMRRLNVPKEVREKAKAELRKRGRR